MPVKVRETNRCNENCKQPAHDHCEGLRHQQKDGVDEEHIVAYHIAYDALVHEARIWVKQRADDQHNNQPRFIHQPGRTVGYDRQNQNRKQRSENKLADLVVGRQPAKSFQKKRMHKTPLKRWFETQLKIVTTTSCLRFFLQKAALTEARKSDVVDDFVHCRQASPDLQRIACWLSRSN
jgi:hypothetical protein